MNMFISGYEYSKIFMDCQNEITDACEGYKRLISLISRLRTHGSFELVNDEIVYFPNIFAWTEYSFRSSSIIKMGAGERADRDRSLRDAQDDEIRTAIRIIGRINSSFDELRDLGKELKEFFYNKEILKLSVDEHMNLQGISKRRYYKLLSSMKWVVKNKFHLTKMKINK